MIDYTVGVDGEIFTGSFVFPGDQMPEGGDTIRVPIAGRDTIVRVNSVRPGAHNYGIQHVELVGSTSREIATR